MRIARRDISRHRGRSLLIVLLIMLPVAGMTGAVTLVQSTLVTPAERVQHQLGQTQARYESQTTGGSAFVQDPLHENIIASRHGEWDPYFESADPRDLLPAEIPVLTERAFDVTVQAGGVRLPVMGNQVDALHAAFKGKFTLLEGKAPASDREVLVSPGLLERAGLTLGAELTTSEGTFRAVGTVRDSGLSDRNSVLYRIPDQSPALPAGQTSATKGDAAGGTRYYVTGSKPVTWADVRAANTEGVVVLSRHVAFNPPPLDQRTVDGGPLQWTPGVPFGAYLTAAYIGALALLEVGLLAGAAFAVGAKRQVRELALLTASGAEAPTVRAVVMAAGWWLGGLAVIGGAAVGLLTAGVVVFAARSIGSARFSGYHPDLLLTAGAMGMGLLACLLSAYAPAWRISRQAALMALKSGREPSSRPYWTTRIGSTLLVLGAASLLGGRLYAASTDHPDVLAERASLIAGLLIAGAVLAVIALLLLTGPVLSFLTRHVAGSPLAMRMASRDAARNLGRTVPAVGAVLAAATLASAGMVAAATGEERSARQTSANLRVNQAQLTLGTADAGGSWTTIEHGHVVAAIDRAAPDLVAWTQVLTYPRVVHNCQHAPTASAASAAEVPRDAEAVGPARTPTANCLQYALAVPEGNECVITEEGRVRYPDDWRCTGSMLPYGSASSSVLVGGEAEIRAVFGRNAPPEALAVLDAGGMVVTNRAFVKDGFVVLREEDVRLPAEGTREARWETVAATELPAVVLEPVGTMGLYGVVSPATAERLGMQPEASALRIQFREYPSEEEMAALTTEVAGIYGNSQGFLVQGAGTANQGLVIWGIVGLAALITLSAAGIATGLSLADARTDHLTLAGVGASPALRKALAGSQALLTVGLGTILGAVAGVLPMLLILSSTEMKPFLDLPWIQLGALVVVVPLAAAALAWLGTRGQLPTSRHALSSRAW